MPTEVIMPKVDMDMASGKILTWHVADGQKVEKGDPLFDIETDKAAMEVESPASGILHHPVPEGTDVAIGKPVAWLYAEGEAVGAAPSAAAAAPAPVAEPEPALETVAAAVEAPASAALLAEKPRATPLARSLARTFGLDLGSIGGSGPRGRVQAGDVRELAARLETPATAEARAEIPAAEQPAAPAPGFAAEGGPLSVTRSKGGTGVPVVLIHGFANDAASWAPVETYLSHRPIIRIDLPCHGKSPKRPLRDFAALAAEVRRTFDDLGLEAAHLVGHSLGGAVALAIADTRPRAVKSLTLIAPAGLGPEINGAALDGIGRAARPESLGPWLRQLVADERLITDGYVRAAFAARRDPALRSAQQALADAVFPDGVQGFDLRAALGRLEMPARILWGKRDAVIPWRHALAAPGQIALHLFDGLGHVPQFEAPEMVGKLLAGAL